MTNTNNNVARDALKKVESLYNKALKKGDKVLLGLLGPAHKQIKEAANLITPDAKEIYSASKKVIQNPNVATVTNLGITLGTEVLPIAATAKPLIKKGNQVMSKRKVAQELIEQVTRKSKKPTRKSPVSKSSRPRKDTPKVPKGESQLSHMKKDVKEAAAARKRAAANKEGNPFGGPDKKLNEAWERQAKAKAAKRAKVAEARKRAAAEKRAAAAKKKAEEKRAAAAKKKAEEKTKDKKSETRPFPIGKIGTGFGTIALLASQKSKDKANQKDEKLPEREVGDAPKVTAYKPADPTPAREKTGSEYKAYPGAAGRAGFEYGRDITEVLDDETVSPEIKERLEEEELYEGDFKGGRVGKSKKKKVSKAPRGVRAAMRGYKTMKIGGKVGKRTRGTGGSWV